MSRTCQCVIVATMVPQDLLSYPFPGSNVSSTFTHDYMGWNPHSRWAAQKTQNGMPRRATYRWRWREAWPAGQRSSRMLSWLLLSGCGQWSWWSLSCSVHFGLYLTAKWNRGHTDCYTCMVSTQISKLFFPPVVGHKDTKSWVWD